MKNQKTKAKTRIMISIVLAIFIALLFSTSVLALGVAPSREIIDYEQGEHTYTFRIINNENTDMKLAIYPKGELAEYTTLETNLVKLKSSEGEKSVSYTVNLPDGLNPGVRELGIVVLQLPETFAEQEDSVLVVDGQAMILDSKEQESMISATTAVVHQLQVRVPYPDSHVEGRLHVSQGKIGETFTFTISLANRGTQPAEVYADITIKGPTNEEIDTIKTEKITVKAGEGENLVSAWKADVNQGVYFAEAIVHYGDQYFVIRKEFFVGNQFVSIEDLKVEGFRLGGIAKFDVYVKNKWNQEIQDVYGELTVLDKEGNDLSTIKTLSTDLPGYGDDTLNAYWDTSAVEVGSYDVNVVLHYAGKTTEKLFNTIVSLDKITIGQLSAGKVAGGEEGNGSLVTILIAVVVLLILINIGWFMFFRKKMKKPPSNNL